MSDWVFEIVNHLLAIVFFVICLYPLYFIVIASFSNASLVTTGQVYLFPRGFTLAGYEMMLEKKEIWSGYLNTILYTVVGTSFNICLTIPAGYALSIKKLPFRAVINFFFILTMFISGGLVPTYLLVNSLHLTNTFAIMVIMGGVNVWNLVLCRNFYNTNIPGELREAAQIDGSSEFRIFLQIVVPLSKAIIAVMVLYYAVQHWNSYYNAMIYLRDTDKYPLQLVLRNLLLQNSLSAEMDDSAMERLMDVQSMKYGVIVIASLPVMLLYPFIQKYFVKGVMVGSVKG